MTVEIFWNILTSHSVLVRISDLFFLVLCYGVLAYNNHPKHTGVRFFAEYLLMVAVSFLGIIFWEALPVSRIAHQLLYTANFLLCGNLFALLFVRGSMLVKSVEIFFFSTAYFQLLLIDLGLRAVLLRHFGSQAVFLQYLGRPREGRIMFPALLLVSLFLVRMHLKNTYRPPKFYWLSLILSSSFSIFVCLMNNIFIPSTGNYWRFIYILNGSVSMLVLFFILYLNSSLVRVYEQTAKEKGIQSRMENDSLRADELEGVLQENAMLRHDFFNHILVLENMLEKQQNDRALRYLENLYEDPVRDASAISTGNYIADIILNQHAVRAKQKGIGWFIDAMIPCTPQMKEAEFSSLLFNILDNALENCCGDRPVIDVYMRPYKEYLKIRVKNSADMEQLRKNPNLCTSKKNPRMHGVGLQLIRYLTDKYDGILDIEIENGFFILTCMVKTDGAEISKS